MMNDELFDADFHHTTATTQSAATACMDQRKKYRLDRQAEPHNGCSCRAAPEWLMCVFYK